AQRRPGTCGFQLSTLKGFNRGAARYCIPRVRCATPGYEIQRLRRRWFQYPLSLLRRPSGDINYLTRNKQSAATPSTEAFAPGKRRIAPRHGVMTSEVVMLRNSHWRIWAALGLGVILGQRVAFLNQDFIRPGRAGAEPQAPRPAVAQADAQKPN